MRACASLIWLSITIVPFADWVMCNVFGAPAGIRPMMPAVATRRLFASSSFQVPDKSGACALTTVAAAMTLRQGDFSGTRAAGERVRVEGCASVGSEVEGDDLLAIARV